MPGPVQPETRAQIVEALETRPDVGRNALAIEFGVGGATITRIANSIGHEFNREASALAVAIRTVELADLRGELAKAALLRGWQALEDMDAPMVITHFESGAQYDEVVTVGGEERVVSRYRKGEFREHVLDGPTTSDRRNLATVFGIMTQRAADLTRASNGAGAEAGAGLLDELGTALHVAAERLREDPTTDPTVVPDVGD